MAIGPSQARDGSAIRTGNFVVTNETRDEDKWYWNWPGVVRSVGGSRATVEFLGFGNAQARTMELHVSTIMPIAEATVAARLHRVFTALNLGPSSAHAGPVPAKSARQPIAAKIDADDND